jgi:serine/threonine-protein kinase
MPLIPDQQLDEFKIIRRLGGGGFGTVYLAHDTVLNRPVALKELHAFDEGDEMRRRFVQEAATIGSLQHPHIVTIYRLIQHAPAHYLVLEYVAGGSLRDRLAAGPLAMRAALQITAEVCDALAELHQRGIIHRDIKPENILLTDEGRAKVTDFGIAHVPREAGGLGLTQTGAQMGTGLYMSPEQVRGDKLTGASDVYQLVTVLYEMLTGKHYFDSNALLDKAMQEMKSGNPQSPLVQGRWMMLVWQTILAGDRPARLDASAEINALLNDGLMADPEPRPTAADFGRRVRLALRERPATLTLTLPGEIALTLHRIPAGRCGVGCDPAKDSLAHECETPATDMWLEDFYLGQFPVTQTQFAAFVQATGHRPPLRWKNQRLPIGEEQYPVSHVTWDDAQAFCRWASERTGYAVRLPTEAEWEKAARGPRGRVWPWGNKGPTASVCNLENDPGLGHGPVGRYSPRGDSGYGCADMARNVAEWTSSLFRPYPYAADDGREDPKPRTRRVVRGGGGRYASPTGASLRCAARHAELPDNRNWHVGFRVALTLPLTD